MDAALAELLNETKVRLGHRWPDIGYDEDVRCWRASRPIGVTGSHHITATELPKLVALLDAEAAR